MNLADLSPEARAALEAKALHGAWHPRQLRRLLAEFDQLDQVAEKGKKRAKWVLGTGCFLMAASVFMAVIIGIKLQSIPLVLACLIVPVIITLIGAKMSNRAAAIDVPNELRSTLRPLLKRLRQDIDPERKIRVRLSFAGIDTRKAASEREYPARTRGTVKESTYHEDLGLIRIPLAGGGAASIRIANTYLQLARSYRTSRGKSKSKFKWKKITTVTARLGPAARLRRRFKFKQYNDPPGECVSPGHVLGLLVELAVRGKLSGSSPDRGNE
jgi:hypothetical protein